MLVEKTNDLVKEIEDIKEYMFKEFGEDINDMDEPESTLFKKLFNVLGKTNDLIKEYSAVIEGIDAKLDKLLS